MVPESSFDRFLDKLASEWQIFTSDQERELLRREIEALDGADEHGREVDELIRKFLDEIPREEVLRYLEEAEKEKPEEAEPNGDFDDDGEDDEEVPTDPAFYLSSDEDDISDMVQMFVETGRFSDAWELIGRALQYRPYSADLLWWKASLLAAKGKFDAAEEMLEQALSLSPDDDRIVATYIELLIIQGRFEEAEHRLSELQTEETSGPELAMVRVIYHLVRRRRRQVLQAFEEGFSAHPYLEQWAEMAVVVYRIAGGNARLFRFLTALHRRHPDLPTPLVALGNLYLFRKQWEQARWHYKKALETDPTLGEIYLRMSIIAIQQNRKKEALEYLEKANEWGWDWNVINPQGFSLFFDQAMHRFLGGTWDDLFNTSSSEDNDNSSE